MHVRLKARNWNVALTQPKFTYVSLLLYINAVLNQDPSIHVFLTDGSYMKTIFLRTATICL